MVRATIAFIARNQGVVIGLPSRSLGTAEGETNSPPTFYFGVAAFTLRWRAGEGWNRNTQKRCSFSARLDLSILQRRWREQKFSRTKIDIDATDRPSQTADDCELSRRRDLARRKEIPFLDLEQLMFHKHFTRRMDQIRRNIVKVD